jgi:hypothetical protein
MEMQATSDQTAFVRQTMQAGGVNSGEESAQEVQALWDDREKRRVQFRLSLIHARSYLSRAAKTLTQCVSAEPQGR